MRSIVVSFIALVTLLASFPLAHGDGRETCDNAAPSRPTLVGNGMKNGVAGWAGLPYFFNATATDADGDAVTYAWRVDGQPLNVTGPSLRRAFGIVPGTYVVAVRAIDDPSARGPSCAPAASEEATLTFAAFELPTVEHAGPHTCALLSCVGLLRGDHDVHAHATDPHQVLARLWLVLDGEPAPVRAEHVARGADGRLHLTATMRSDDVPMGTHRVAACAAADDDVHHVVACSRSSPAVDLD